MTVGTEPSKQIVKLRCKVGALRASLYQLEAEYLALSLPPTEPDGAEAETMIASLQIAREGLTRGYVYGVERNVNMRRGK